MKKLKFKSAEEKRRHEENQKSWNALVAKYPEKKIKTSKTLEYSPSNPPGRERIIAESRVTPGGSTAKKQTEMYSGSMMRGIGMMHKSNFVPVFKDEEAKDLASMRR